jgi:hypothetical protein
MMMYGGAHTPRGARLGLQIDLVLPTNIHINNVIKTCVRCIESSRVSREKKRDGADRRRQKRVVNAEIQVSDSAYCEMTCACLKITMRKRAECATRCR